MDAITNWAGKAYGWIGNDGLFDTQGRHVGQFYRGLIYAEGGTYIGEVVQGRLIEDSMKRETHAWYGFVPNPEPTKGPDGSLKELPPLDVPAGYEEFPTAEAILAVAEVR